MRQPALRQAAKALGLMSMLRLLMCSLRLLTSVVPRRRPGGTLTATVRKRNSK